MRKSRKLRLHLASLNKQIPALRKTGNEAYATELASNRRIIKAQIRFNKGAVDYYSQPKSLRLSDLT